MAWTRTKAPQVTDDGIIYEFQGDKVDQQGRPLRVEVALAPFDPPVPPVVKNIPPAVQQATERYALAQVIAAAGDGTDIAKPAGKLALARGLVTHPATTHTAAVAAGTGLVQLALHLL